MFYTITRRAFLLQTECFRAVISSYNNDSLMPKIVLFVVEMYDSYYQAKLDPTL